MPQDSDARLPDDLASVLERLADDPRLLQTLTERLARRPAFRRQVAEFLKEGEVIPSPYLPQEILDRSVISSALRAWLATHRPGGDDRPFPVIIDLNLKHTGNRESTAEQLRHLIQDQVPDATIDDQKTRLLPQYVFASLTRAGLAALVLADAQAGKDDLPETVRTIHRIWPDFELQATLHRTGATIKAEAARVSFAAAGQNIVWAVLDSGIDGTHPHFERYETLKVAPLDHQVFTGEGEALTDEFGHGTHVAGIIAGGQELPEGESPGPSPLHAVVAHRDGEDADVTYHPLPLRKISGVAPQCKLVSYKVLNGRGKGVVSNLLAAIAHIQQVNGNGKLLQIHGVNISIGYGFDPEWFACGQSPLCVEVDRLVRSGVVVVVAAGNTGYGTVASKLLGMVPTTLALTINDPGNAELAITVGASHRESPHQYGVSYFSSKGPTGDGRLKPDLVAPGERVLSCAAGSKRAQIEAKGHTGVTYLEDSGTSMAAPHVSGAAAAFLSVQREFIGRPEEVKRILMKTATDLGRHRDFQGAGMVDVMRAIQSV